MLPCLGNNCNNFLKILKNEQKLMNLKCDCENCRCSLCNNEGHIPMKCYVILYYDKNLNKVFKFMK